MEMRCGGWPEPSPTFTRMGHATGILRSLPVTKLAEDRAEQLKRDPDKVVHELDLRLRARIWNGRRTSAVSTRCRSRGKMRGLHCW